MNQLNRNLESASIFSDTNGNLKVKFKKTNKSITFNNLESLQKVVDENLHERSYNHIDTDFDKYNDEESVI